MAEYEEISQQILVKINTGTLETITLHPHLHLTLIALEAQRSHRVHLQLNMEENKGIRREGSSWLLRSLNNLSLYDLVLFKHQLQLTPNAGTDQNLRSEERRVSLYYQPKGSVKI